MQSLTGFITLLFIAGYAMGQGSHSMFGGRSRSLGRHTGSMGGRGLGGRSSPFRGRGIPEDPESIRRILGSTVAGRELRMGELGLPRHGGAGIGEQYANGMLNGWNGDPQTLTTQFQDSWSDPFMGRPVPQLPSGFNGDFSSLGGGFGMPRYRGSRQFWCHTFDGVDKGK